ncbi:sensor domain-containing diguanylate cyclase/phosphohydrolase [Alkaliphilus peptidifermentans]|uniref:PAS domain S-box-containing protein/diguanylate cyclase (GGDEF) domain-containing protein n=1 Tax=Alkaliphilus peptidifermentans DSM 18978 TaxID=1120976 RepID=A0A1G5F1J6_9FIRM|nr:PAS domain S-box protein [Alkaliphilus peptidifermentans]SCY33116.1 PAS domain S-box-containing protein/diguanylate cyclase (GGDEF) domain-containing protein [Alkaliphilus peptidifermentans DSM 18978]
MINKKYENTNMTLFDDALMGIFRSTLDARFLYVNKLFAHILKYDSPDDVLKSVHNIEEQVYVKKNREELTNIIKKEGRLSNYEIEYYCKDGSIVAAVLNMRLVEDIEGNYFLEGFISDVSDMKKKEVILKENEQRLQELNEELEAALQQLKANEEVLHDHYNRLKENEKALTESEERWYFALEGSENGVWDWDILNNKIFRSDQYKKMRGFTKTEMNDSLDSWTSHLHPLDKETVLKELKDHIDGNSPIYSVEYRLMCKDGTYMWIHERGKVMVRDHMGKPIRMVGTHMNINKRKEAEEAIQYQKNLFESLFNNSPEAIAYFDSDEKILDINSRFTELFGYNDCEIKGKRISEVVDTEGKLNNFGIRTVLEGKPFLLEDVIRFNKQGKPLHLIVKGAPIIIKNKTVGGYAIYTDIRAIKKAEAKIRRQQKILESLFKYSPDAIVHMDMEGNIIQINEKFYQMFGYSQEECKGNHLNNLIVTEEYINDAKNIDIMAFNRSDLDIESKRIKKDGSFIDVKLRGGATVVDGEIIGYHAIYTDITAQKKAEEHIKYLSYHDKLTGLYNRAYFEEILEKLDAENQHPLAIIIGDVNGLKLINDVFGHQEGDKLLITIAEILKKACRFDDIVCRWGGDEFAIMLPNSNESDAREVCKRIDQLRLESKNTPIRISIATGFAVKQDKFKNMKEVKKEAEEKMYRNKLMEETSMRSNIILSLQQSLYERSNETEEHAQRMKDLSIRLGKKLELDSDKIAELSLLAIIHDIGKIAISDIILDKPSKLTEAEWEEMKKHTEIGYRIANTTPELMHISKYVLFHHERWDGRGYPKGLKGNEIPLLSRIIAIIDAYDVMTHSRPYKKPISHEEAIEEIVKCSGSQFDPEIAKIFVDLFK